MALRSTIRKATATGSDTCQWQGEKLRLIERIHLSNPQPKVVLLESGTGNDIALIDERRSLGENHKLWLALEQIRHKLRGNALKPGMRVVQRSCSGAAATMAFVCARLGLPFTAIVAHDIAVRARDLIQSHGGELVVAERPADAHDAEAGFAIRPGYTVIDPYSAEVRALPTRHSPGERMLRAASVAVGRMPSAAVVAVGTGTTANSIRFAASDRQMALDVIGVDIAGGVLTDYVGLNLHGRNDKPHCIDGASPGYVPSSFIRTSVDRFLEVRPEAAIALCHLFRHEFGFSMGPSSGMALYGALTELQNMKGRRDGELVATFCYDGGARYEETIYNPDFLKKKGLDIAAWREPVESLIAELK